MSRTSAAILITTFSLLIAPSATAQGLEEIAPATPTLQWSFESTVVSKYVWRGFTDYTGPSWQNNFTLGWKGLQGSMWVEAGKEDGQHMVVREQDFDVHYEREFRRTTYTVGYAAYCTLLTDSLAHEVYASVSRGLRTVGTLAVYQNLGWPNGTYVSAEVSRHFRLGPTWSMQLAASVGLNREMYIDSVTFSDATVAASLTKRLANRLQISPAIGASKGLNRKYFKDHFYGGLSISYAN